MIKLGITGGIGSGKSTICRFFAILGIPIYYADDSAKWLMQNDATLITTLKDVFGPTIYTEDQQLNRAKLADIVFNDKSKLEQLNALVHPAVAQHSLEWTAQQTALQHPYSIKEAALLIESGSYKYLDALIVVTAPKALRLQRVMRRDNVSEEQVLARMNKQLSEEEKVKQANFLIHNDEQQSLTPQVWRLHQHFLKAAKGEVVLW